MNYSLWGSSFLWGRGLISRVNCDRVDDGGKYLDCIMSGWTGSYFLC